MPVVACPHCVKHLMKETGCTEAEAIAELLDSPIVGETLDGEPVVGPRDGGSDAV